MPETTLDALMRVAVTTRDAQLFAQVRPLLPPVSASAPNPPAYDAWSRGDAYFAASDWTRAKFWWSAALRFGDVPSSHEADALLDLAADESQAPALRARAAMRLTVSQEAQDQTFFLAEGAIHMLDTILGWAPDYLPAQILRGAQALTVHDETKADTLLLRLWPSAMAAGLLPAPLPPAIESPAQRLDAWQSVAAAWPELLLPQYACAVGMYEQGDRLGSERRARELSWLEPNATAPHDMLAQLYTEANQWTKARDAWRNSVLRDGSRPEVWLGLATSQLVLGEADAAEESLRCHSSTLDAPSATRWLHVAYALALKPGLANERAIAAFRAVLSDVARTPDDEINALLNLGVTLRAAGRPQEASVALSRGRALLPAPAANRTELDLPSARALYDAGDVEAAIEAYESFLSDHADDEDALWELVQALVDAGRVSQAREHLDAIAAQAPSEFTIRRRLGRAYLRTEDLMQARRWLEPLQQEDPSVDTLLSLMHVLEDDGLAENAAALAQWHVEQQRPLEPRVFERWARVLMHSEQTDRALQICEQGCSLFPDSASLIFHMAMVLGAQGAMAASEPLLQQVLRLDPNHIECLQLVARMPAQQDAALTKLDALTRMFELVPDDLSVAMQLALEAKEQQEMALCLRACDRAATSEEFVALALHLKGFVMRQQGDWSGACVVFEQALAAAPNEASLWNELGSTREALQQWDEAHECWRHARRLEAEDESALQEETRATRHSAHRELSPSRQSGPGSPRAQSV